MKYVGNIAEIAALQPDFMGFIFYKPSPRYAGNKLSKISLNKLGKQTKPVAVFVNEKLEEVLKICVSYNFTFAQLHGNEPADYCQELKQAGLNIIKAFHIHQEFDFDSTQPYESSADYFLFDTKGAGYGGTGKSFNWKILNKYTGKTPFFLSGGIDLNNSTTAFQIMHPSLYAIDVNSQFEIKPGMKDLQKLTTLIDLKNEHL